MSALGVSASRSARWTGRTAEGIAGGLTLLVGVGTILALGFGPWTCAPGGTPCVGLLGASPTQWLDMVGVLTIWLPLLSVIALGAGAVLNARRQHTRFAVMRWAMMLAIGLATLLLLVVSPLGVIMIPVAVIAYLTAGIGQLRAQRGEAPASIAGPVLGGAATIVFVAIVFLLVQNLPLLLR